MVQSLTQSLSWARRELCLGAVNAEALSNQPAAFISLHYFKFLGSSWKRLSESPVLNLPTDKNLRRNALHSSWHAKREWSCRNWAKVTVIGGKGVLSQGFTCNLCRHSSQQKGRPPHQLHSTFTPRSQKLVASRIHALQDQNETADQNDVPKSSNQNTTTDRPPSTDPPLLPGLTAGVNWYCLSMIGLVTLIDFSPLGPILRSTSGAAVPWILAGIQWAFFVAPTISSCRSEGYHLRQTFGFNWCRPLDFLASLAAGASLWAVLTAAIAARVAADGGQIPTSESVVIADLLFSKPASAAEWASLLTSAGVSPGIAEELLFRGFLLTSLRQGLGRVDAVVLCAALFGLFHLSVPQFFPTTVLGLVAGLSAIASGSIGGPIAVHTAHNVAALIYGGLAGDHSMYLPMSIAAAGHFTLFISGGYLLLKARDAR